MTVSSDGRHAYVASRDSGAVAVFARDPGTGALTQLPRQAGCVSRSGGEGCAQGRALDFATSVTVSRDGRHAYVTSDGAVAVFARDRRTGSLTQLPGATGCVSTAGAEGCAEGRALDGASAVTLSGDGRHAYVASSLDSDAVVVFARDPAAGALTQLPGAAGCVRQGGGEGCAHGRALEGAGEVTVSPDGRSAYAASRFSDAVAVFGRDRRSGVLTQLPGPSGCVSRRGRGCRRGRGFDFATSVTVSPDGRHAYVASQSGAVAVFAREHRPRRGPRPRRPRFTG